MDFELHPTVSLRSRSFSVLQAPRDLFIQALNKNLNLQRYKVLYVCGNYSGILSKLDRKFTDLDVRRAFTVFQLMTVLEEARHSIIIVEHDPMLYEDAAEMVEYVSHALSDAGKEAAVLLYSPGSDPFLEGLSRDADRMFYFDEGPRASPRLVAKAFPKAERNQTTLEVFS
jgi:DNA polymerase I